MDRILMRPIGAPPKTVCWHCAEPIDLEHGTHAARYIYRAEQRLMAVVEDWMLCRCGAYQNLRSLNEITIETVGKT